ncbi:MAG: TolC family protein, partial [Pseudomonadota bacterium]|nr:TolC family protein [Pseudomonadota bacterium]
MAKRHRRKAGIVDSVGMLMLLAVLASPANAGNAPATRVDTLTAEQAVAMALEGNPGLSEVQARAAAAAAIPSQEGALPDPSISFNALNLPVDTFDLGQEAMTQLQLAVSQSFPFPGKLSLKEAAAQFDADALVNGVDEARLQLVREVRAAWWRIFYLDRSIEIVDRNLDLLKEFVEIARTKYAVGEGLQQDVLLAQVERSQLKDRRITLRAARRGQVATLNALLDRQAGLAVRLPGKVDTRLPETPSAETLFELADQSRPLLARRENELRAAATRVDVAERDRLPDFTVGAGYGFRNGDNPDGTARADFLSLRLGMTVPLYSGRKQARAVDQ